jgi:starvation-inducible DNA-binding protein
MAQVFDYTLAGLFSFHLLSKQKRKKEDVMRTQNTKDANKDAKKINKSAVTAKETPTKMTKKFSPANPVINIGIKEKDRKKITQGLSYLLADTYTLYLKTHNFHWNVTGPMFQTLHLMFETQYNELALAVDLIAERIRALGEYAPGTYSQFSKLTSIQEPETIPSAREMIERLVAGQEAVVRTARSTFPVVEAAGDEATADLLTQRIQLHEKTAWMLRSLLVDQAEQ